MMCIVSILVLRDYPLIKPETFRESVKREKKFRESVNSSKIFRESVIRTPPYPPPLVDPFLLGEISKEDNILTFKSLHK